jgi:hypothetical protein
MLHSLDHFTRADRVIAIDRLRRFSMARISPFVMVACLCCGTKVTLAQNAAPQTSKLDTYFEQYCNYTGGLGIGFVASHTYDYKFRQHLKETKDTELKRLFVLQHLYRDVALDMRDYERGEIRVGKVEYRKMTKAETEAAKTRLLEMLDDLERFDPKDPEDEIARNRSKLK